MKELDNISVNYAAGKTNEAIDKAIAQAYADGYRDGYKDREEEIPVDLRDNKMEYIDLGLPSGTLWSTDYEKIDNDNYLFVPYVDTKKYNIPNKEQWEELVNVCKWEYDKNGGFREAYCIGPNGKVLKFCLTGLIHVEYVVEEGKVFFWISDENEGDEKSAVYIYDRSLNGYKYTDKGIESFFLATNCLFV